MKRSGLRMFVESVKSKIDIRDVIGKYMKLVRNNKTGCLFNGDRNPSFSINSKARCSYDKLFLATFYREYFIKLYLKGWRGE